DYETISAAITAAETGTLLISTLHTSSAVNTITRIIDVFPASQQHQVKIQLSQILKGIVCQQLVNGVNGELLPAFEVLKTNSAVQNMIREDKLHQLNSVMQSSAAEGMFTMDSYLLDLYKQGKISKEDALLSCVNYEAFAKRL
ncbi:MAG: Flp pilus assembly complex ATPase component TadA, partial [Erysipelotrichaceae bacterium]|nr:Flp pilus assembly complex ATPase component TadA [Erysipelotrichaceae bacterium]